MNKKLQQLKKRKKAVLLASMSAVLLCLVCILFFNRLSERREPIYQGRYLTQWLEDYEDADADITPGNSAISNRVTKIDASTVALRAMGTNAFPFLLDMLQARNSKLKVTTYSLIQSFVGIGYILPETKHHMAYWAFYRLGTNGLPAAPALAELMKTGDERMRVATYDCLENMGAWETLRPTILYIFKNNPDPAARKDAAYKIIFLFPDEAEKAGVYIAFPELIDVKNHLYPEQQTIDKK